MNNNLKKILGSIDGDMKKLNQIIQKQLQSEVTLINKICDYIIEAGGKRLRPAILIMVFQSLNKENIKNKISYCYEMAAVIEFIHTATLLHDDVIDESLLRRGRASVNTTFGSTISILVGDFLYSRAFQIMIKVKQWRIMQILANTTNSIAEGEVLQLLNMFDCTVTEERYMKVINYKTAKLFEASASLGAILANCNKKELISAQQYGLHIGIAFQIMDDLLDYTANANSIGKNIGNDLREGKPTLPLIYLLERGNSFQKKLIQNTMQNQKKISEENLKKIHEEIINSDSLKYTKYKIKEEVRLAIQALAIFPENIYKKSLMEFCKYFLE